jgi:hypothetical protein
LPVAVNVAAFVSIQFFVLDLLTWRLLEAGRDELPLVRVNLSAALEAN